MDNPYQNSLSINVADLDQQNNTVYLDPLTGAIQGSQEQPDFQGNMGIARFSQRHSPSLDNLFSNRDGKAFFISQNSRTLNKVHTLALLYGYATYYRQQ